MKRLLVLALALCLAGCATLNSDVLPSPRPTPLEIGAGLAKEGIAGQFKIREWDVVPDRPDVIDLERRNGPAMLIYRNIRVRGHGNDFGYGASVVFGHMSGSNSSQVFVYTHRDVMMGPENQILDSR